MITKEQEKLYENLNKLLLEGKVIIDEENFKEFEDLIEEIGEKEHVEKKGNYYFFKSKKANKEIDYCQEGHFFI